ncbi:MAG: arginyltransferase [Alphaproteobacteria bacterium]|nr:arginyltransferase [Alphaproteobacteria bacterium]
MSFISDELKELPFYLTRPSPCPYLEGQVEQKIFTRLLADNQSDFLLSSQLTPLGFRRSQTIMYRPACPSCSACVPVRICVADFNLTRNLKRIHVKNSDLMSVVISTRDAAPLFNLFNAYQRARHHESDMAQMALSDFMAMMNEGSDNAALLCLRDASGNIIAAMLMDTLGDGTSAVYSFFDPAQEKRSLGTELILRLVEYTGGQALAFVYLGYWIKQCQKMAYKARFPALQRLTAHGWEAFIPADR